MGFVEIIRVQAAVVVIATLVNFCDTAPSKHLVVFHNNIPSNLYVNAAHGPTHIKDDPDGKTEIIHLLLYPSDKKSRAPKTARVVFYSGPLSGIITLRQDNPPTGPTFIAGSLKGLTPGKHGLKIFEFGDIEDNCSAVGNTYNPYKLDLAPAFRRRDTGDLGFIIADEKGKAEIAMSDPLVTLVGPRSVIGRSIVITEEDNESGFTQVKMGCGVIGYAR